MDTDIVTNMQNTIDIHIDIGKCRSRYSLDRGYFQKRDVSLESLLP